MVSKPPYPLSYTVSLYYVLCYNLYDTICIIYLMKTLLHNYTKKICVANFFLQKHYL